MKTIQLTVLCILLFVSLGFSSSPDSNNPPDDWIPTYEEPMSIMNGETDNSPAAPGQVDTPLKTTLVLEQNHTTVAYSGSAEQYPKVSSCGDSAGLYLVVYEESYDIRGRKLDRNGETIGDEFTIFDGSSDSDYFFDPDVSCELFRNRFIVVAGHIASSYQAIEAVAVKGTSSPGSELLAGILSIRSSISITYKQPAIACDSENRACLVVFVAENASDDILAQRLGDNSSEPYLSIWGDMFSLATDSIDENTPDVAWGGNDDSYLVVWQFMHNTLSHYQLVFSHVRETEQGNGSVETYHGPVYLFGSHTNHQLSARIAYNRDDPTLPYWVVFTYDGQGDLSDFDVYAQGVGGTAATVFDYTEGQLIAAMGLYPYDEAWPDIAFAAGNENFAQGHPDQFMITFICGSTSDISEALCARTLQSDWPYAVNEEWWEYFTLDFTGDRTIGYATVIGTIYNNRYLVAWDEQYSTGSEDYDIFASLIAPFGTFAPLIRK